MGALQIYNRTIMNLKGGKGAAAIAANRDEIKAGKKKKRSWLLKIIGGCGKR